MIILVTAVILIILLINYYNNPNGTTNEDVIQCIADNSKVVVSKTCSACASQKQILGEHLDLFDQIDIAVYPEIRAKYNIRGVPTWIVKEKPYTGVKTLEQLKVLTGC